jgi:hypothetical protein
MGEDEGHKSSRRIRRVGFTGTQETLNKFQLKSLKRLLSWCGNHVLHHGDCIGADASAHDIADQIGMRVVIHPPINPTKRAFKTAMQVLECKPYIERNHDIVGMTDWLIACPKGGEEQRSGTWATVRYARKQNKLIWIVYPDGTIQVDNIPVRSVFDATV